MQFDITPKQQCWYVRVNLLNGNFSKKKSLVSILNGLPSSSFALSRLLAGKFILNRVCVISIIQAINIFPLVVKVCPCHPHVYWTLHFPGIQRNITIKMENEHNLFSTLHCDILSSMFLLIITSDTHT